MEQFNEILLKYLAEDESADSFSERMKVNDLQNRRLDIMSSSISHDTHKRVEIISKLRTLIEAI